MTYQIIDISDDVIMAQDSPAQQEFKDLSSGMYRCRIKQAYVRLSKSSSAMGLNLTLEILKDHKGNTYDNFTKDIAIWYIKGDGTTSDYGVGILGSMLGILGLPKKLGGDLFRHGLVEVREYDSNAGKFSSRQIGVTVMPSLVGKEIWALIGLTYEMYNDKQTKSYSINSFYNDNMQSYNESKQGLQPELWIKRLASAQTREQKSFDETSGGYAGYSQPNVSAPAIPAAPAQSAENAGVKEEIPF